MEELFHVWPEDQAAHSTLFGWQQTLNENLESQPGSGARPIEGFKMPKIDEEDNLVTYLESFKKQASAAGWEQEHRAYQLGPLFDWPSSGCI